MKKAYFENKHKNVVFWTFDLQIGTFLSVYLHEILLVKFYNEGFLTNLSIIYAKYWIKIFRKDNIVMCSSTIIEHKNESVAKQLVCCSRFEFCQSI